MERVYSAFFTVDRPLTPLQQQRNENEPQQTAPLTAKALEKHNESLAQQQQQQQQQQQRQRQCISGSGAVLDEQLLDRLSDPDRRDNAAARRRGGNDDDDATDEHTLVARRRDFAQLTLNYNDIKRDLKAALKGALRVFLYAYGAKAFTALLLASRKWSAKEYDYVDAARLLLRLDTIRFGAFFGSLVGVVRVTEIAARVARGGTKDATNLAIAGAVAGLTLFIDSPNRRSTISLYIFVRMLDVVGRRLTATGVLPSYKFASELLFASSNAPIMYAFIFQPDLLPKSYYNWILNIGAVTHHGLEYTLRERVIANGIDATTGVEIPFRVCQPHYHMESCLTHSVKEWIGGFGRAAQVYLPVHILPALIFRFAQVQKAPVASMIRISTAALCSCLFLTSYQTSVKLVMCALRNLFQRDFRVAGWIAGFGTGASLLLENRKRRSELMLYCLTRALDIVWQLLKRRRLAAYVQHSEVALFSLSLAAILSSPPEHFKPTYLSILRFLFGRTIV